MRESKRRPGAEAPGRWIRVQALRLRALVAFVLAFTASAVVAGAAAGIPAMLTGTLAATALAATTLAAATLTTAALAATTLAAMPSAALSAAALSAAAAAAVIATVATGGALDDAKQAAERSQRFGWVATAAVFAITAVMAAAVIATSVVTAIAVVTTTVAIIAAVAVVAAAILIAMAAPTIAPLVAHSEAVTAVEIETQRRADAINASPARTRTAPLIAPPIALDPIPVFSLVAAVVDRPVVPTAAEVHRAIVNGIVPELIGTAEFVAVSSAVIGEIDSGPSVMALCIGGRRPKQRRADDCGYRNRGLQ